MITISDLSLNFSGEPLFKDVNLKFTQGNCYGVIGANGAGKSTFLRILSGDLDPSTGTVSIAPKTRMSVLKQDHFAFNDETVLNTVLGGNERLLEVMHEKDALYMKDPFTEEDGNRAAELESEFAEMGGWDAETEASQLLNGLGLDADAILYTEMKNLGDVEKVKVLLARALFGKPDILLLDEPTNHLDMHAVEWLEEYISRFKGTVLTISHDRYFLDRVVNRIIEISNGKAEFYSGNYSFYVQEKQARFELQLKQYEKEQAKLSQLGFTLERMKGWGINNRTLYRRAMSIQHRMDRIEKTDKPKTEKTMRARFAERDFFGDEVLSVKGLGKAFDGRTLFHDVDLQVAGGERIALLGDNGTGKTTFLKVLLGEEAGVGKIKFGPTVKWAYLPQIIHFEHPERTLLDTMLYEKNCTVQTARDRLGAYLFEGEDVFKTVSSLSGGEQSRLRLCMLMDEKIDLLILDEPTNHLDLASREWVEDALEEYEGALLFVSHDRYFVDKFATRIWELENQTIRDFPCGYEKYRSIKAFEAMQIAAPVKEKREKKEKPKPSGGSKAIEKKIKSMEREIEKQETLVAEYDEKIAAASSDYQELTRLMEEKQAEEEKLTGMMDEWEALSLQLEEGV